MFCVHRYIFVYFSVSPIFRDGIVLHCWTTFFSEIGLVHGLTAYRFIYFSKEEYMRLPAEIVSSQG